MQAKALERDAKTKYIQDLERQFHEVQLYAIQQARENYLKTEFILANEEVMDSFVDYLKRVSSQGLENDYMDASSIIDTEIQRYDVSDEDVQDFINDMISTF